MVKEIKVAGHSRNSEVQMREQFFEDFKQCPIPSSEMLSNLGLFLNRQTLSRILFMHEMYQKIIDVHGVVMEFGVRWGQNLALFESFRGMYEPYNYTRKIVGFDTFSGFPSVDAKDGDHSVIDVGAYSVTQGYKDYLERILEYHESESPISHIKKYQLVEGDASQTIEQYLADNPETIIAFDNSLALTYRSLFICKLIEATTILTQGAIVKTYYQIDSGPSGLLYNATLH
jgi:hypothetical protein